MGHCSNGGNLCLKLFLVYQGIYAINDQEDLLPLLVRADTTVDVCPGPRSVCAVTLTEYSVYG